MSKTPLIFIAISKFFYNNKIKFRENLSSTLQNSVNWINSSSKIDNMIQEGEVIFKKKSTVGLPKDVRV